MPPLGPLLRCVPLRYGGITLDLRAPAWAEAQASAPHLQGERVAQGQPCQVGFWSRKWSKVGNSGFARVYEINTLVDVPKTTVFGKTINVFKYTRGLHGHPRGMHCIPRGCHFRVSIDPCQNSQLFGEIAAKLAKLAKPVELPATVD